MQRSPCGWMKSDASMVARFSTGLAHYLSPLMLDVLMLIDGELPHANVNRSELTFTPGAAHKAFYG